MAKKYKKKKMIYHAKKGFRLSAQVIALGLLSLVSVIIVGVLSAVNSQPPQPDVAAEKRQFIETLAPITQEVYKDYGVLPSISLSQAILESDWGTSSLAAQYYNLYGMKGSGASPSVDLETSEFHDGQWVQITGRFRVFSSWKESIVDHAMLMVEGVDWNPNLYQPVLQASNYKEAAHALVTAGYATDPTYAEKLIQMIEEYNLQEYDTLPPTPVESSQE